MLKFLLSLWIQRNLHKIKVSKEDMPGFLIILRQNNLSDAEKADEMYRHAVQVLADRL